MKPWAQGCSCPSALSSCGVQPRWPETGKQEDVPEEATGCRVRCCIVRHYILRHRSPQGGHLSGSEGGVVGYVYAVPCLSCRNWTQEI